MRTSEPTERITVTLTKAQVRMMRLIAATNGQSISSILRHAVSAFLRTPAFFVPAVHTDSIQTAESELADREPAGVA